MTTQLTLRDFQILHALTHCVRLFSVDQIRRCWWSEVSEDSTVVRDRIRLLARADWVRRARAFARPLPKIIEPLFAWQPHKPVPPFDVIAWKVQRRWAEPPKSISVVVASNKACRRLLGRQARGLRQGFQTTHDLGVAEVFLRFQQSRPEFAPLWRGERVIVHLRRRLKVPDAVIADESLWPPKLVVEFAGAYSAQRLREFHHFCVKERLQYEIW